MEKISIIGGGSWGTAIAQLLANNNHQVLIYVRNNNLKDDINQKHFNTKYFPDFKLAENIKATVDLEEAVAFSSYLIMAVPTHATRITIEKMKPFINQDHIFVSTAKGIEEGSFLRNSQIINEYCPNPVTILSGPTHAEEVIKELPSAAVIAAENRELAEHIQDLFMSSTFRAYTNPDVIGVELGGAVKNIIALAAGITDGLGFGDNTQAALITRGLTEMSRLGMFFGGRMLTFAGLAGMGDLVVTCTSMHSRNRRFGIKIGQGLSFDEALAAVKQVVEGVKTTRAVYQLMQQEQLDFELPITSQIHQVLFNDKPAAKAVEDLMLRGPKHEMEEVVEDQGW